MQSAIFSLFIDCENYRIPVFYSVLISACLRVTVLSIPREIGNNTGGVAQRNDRYPWWYSKIVHHLRFIAAVAKIAGIFLVGNIGLGYQDRIRGNDIQNLSTQLYHVMGLGQVDASGADFVPQKSAGVESE